MIFAMVKEFALNLKRENHQRKQRRKARSNTMAKVTLELPKMPENCKECLLHSWKSNGYTLSLICKILLVNGLPHKRRDDCPLKLVEGKEVEP
jgi:hypothetical protein